MAILEAAEASDFQGALGPHLESRVAVEDPVDESLVLEDAHMTIMLLDINELGYTALRKPPRTALPATAMDFLTEDGAEGWPFWVGLKELMNAWVREQTPAWADGPLASLSENLTGPEGPEAEEEEEDKEEEREEAEERPAARRKPRSGAATAAKGDVDAVEGIAKLLKELTAQVTRFEVRLDASEKRSKGLSSEAPQPTLPLKGGGSSSGGGALSKVQSVMGRAPPGRNESRPPRRRRTRTRTRRERRRPSG